MFTHVPGAWQQLLCVAGRGRQLSDLWFGEASSSRSAEASSGSLGQILAEPPFPGLQNGRREGSWELMACEIPPNSDNTILL